MGSIPYGRAEDDSFRMRLSGIIDFSVLLGLVDTIDSKVVQTRNVPIQGGKYEPTDVNYFFSIPYAKPPVGKLRYAPPEPPSASYRGVINATKPTPSCIQFGTLYAETGPQSEDCLYLKVWAPTSATPESNLPVKVWLYGGSNEGGSTSDEGAFFVLGTYGEAAPTLTPSDYDEFLTLNFGPLASHVNETFSLDAVLNGSVAAALVYIITEVSYKCPGHRALLCANEKSIPVWSYRFAHSPSCPWFSTFVFNMTHNMPPPDGDCTFSESEQEITRTMGRAWTNMAEFGTPDDDTGTWPAWTADMNMGVKFKDESEVTVVDYESCAFWNEINDALNEYAAAQQQPLIRIRWPLIGSVSSPTIWNMPLHIVQIGSSFAAGPGIPPVANSKAMRSGANFACLLSKRINAKLTDLSVSGATLLNLISEPQDDFPPQIDLMPTDADVVLVLGGGNDIGYIGSMFEDTLSSSWVGVTATWLLGKGAPLGDVLDTDALAARYGTVLDAIHSKVPKAKVIVVEYATVLGPDVRPGVDVVFTRDRVEHHRAVSAKLLEATVKATKERAPWCERVGVDEPSRGHGIGSNDPWVNGFSWKLLLSGSAYHLNANGMKAVSEIVYDKFVGLGLTAPEGPK
ncbi:hypothetical protein DL762_010443 [Monosporascus cannonballus]|uniref:Carboxylesterase type B domain-containing protein n=1 Tax=Monosporascus cannonballus TaxID=155416 RepID=A0ABY0GUL3_9PEZI|nr:hypothetical protein DL762_010443 [Monosporascus cannonballus]RYO76434.1 hypothetical protein DL763_010475 [Monosporascus cannonballus]